MSPLLLDRAGDAFLINVRHPGKTFDSVKKAMAAYLSSK